MRLPLSFAWLVSSSSRKPRSPLRRSFTGELVKKTIWPCKSICCQVCEKSSQVLTDLERGSAHLHCNGPVWPRLNGKHQYCNHHNHRCYFNHHIHCQQIVLLGPSLIDFHLDQLHIKPSTFTGRCPAILRGLTCCGLNWGSSWSTTRKKSNCLIIWSDVQRMINYWQKKS